MANTTVYSKTQKGNAELKSAQGALGPHLRKLLNLVDGKSTVDQILAKLGRVDTARLAEAFHLLIKDGYIAPAAPSAKAAPAAPAASAKPVAARPPGEPITLDFTSRSDHAPEAPVIDDAPTTPPSAEEKQDAEVLTVAGMRTLKSTGSYVNILSKPGLQQPPRSGDKKYSALILDDDQATALVIARTLMVADFDVRSGETRDAALAELKKVPLPDAIVLNPYMKNLTGLDLLSRLQQHPFYCSVPVIIVTPELKHEDVVDALARGASGYMTKPFKPEALLDTVRAVLGLK